MQGALSRREVRVELVAAVVLACGVLGCTEILGVRDFVDVFEPPVTGGSGGAGGLDGSGGLGGSGGGAEAKLLLGLAVDSGIDPACGGSDTPGFYVLSLDPATGTCSGGRLVAGTLTAIPALVWTTNAVPHGRSVDELPKFQHMRLS